MTANFFTEESRSMFRHYAMSWDTYAAVIVSGLVWFVYPSKSFHDFFERLQLIVSVEAIVVSVLVTVMSILASVSGDDFILFLEERGKVFSSMIHNLRFVIAANLVSIFISFFHPLFVDPLDSAIYNIYEVLAFFVASYAIVSAILVVFEMMHFAESRAQFLRHQLEESTESKVKDGDEGPDGSAN